MEPTEVLKSLLATHGLARCWSAGGKAGAFPHVLGQWTGPTTGSKAAEKAGQGGHRTGQEKGTLGSQRQQDCWQQPNPNPLPRLNPPVLGQTRLAPGNSFCCSKLTLTCYVGLHLGKGTNISLPRGGLHDRLPI